MMTFLSHYFSVFELLDLTLSDNFLKDQIRTVLEQGNSFQRPLHDIVKDELSELSTQAFTDRLAAYCQQVHFILADRCPWSYLIFFERVLSKRLSVLHDNRIFAWNFKFHASTDDNEKWIGIIAFLKYDISLVKF